MGKRSAFLRVSAWALAAAIFSGASQALPAASEKSSPRPSVSPTPAKPEKTKSKAKSKAKTQAKKPKAKTKPEKRLPAVLQEIEKKYAEAGTLSAEFSQINETVVTGQKKTSSGVILVKRPNQVRWETQKPNPSLLVSDGKTYWFYTPPFDEEEPGQLVVRSSSQVQSKLANALLSGSFSTAKDMKITEKTPSTFVLKPKPGTAGTVQKVEIGVDPDKKLIQKVILTHKGGNRAEISLSNIELGKPLDENQFHFEAPKNTEIIKE